MNHLSLFASLMLKSATKHLHSQPPSPKQSCCSVIEGLPSLHYLITSTISFTVILSVSHRPSLPSPLTQPSHADRPSTMIPMIPSLPLPLSLSLHRPVPIQPHRKRRQSQSPCLRRKEIRATTTSSTPSPRPWTRDTKPKVYPVHVQDLFKRVGARGDGGGLGGCYAWIIYSSSPASGYAHMRQWWWWWTGWLTGWWRHAWYWYWYW